MDKKEIQQKAKEFILAMLDDPDIMGIIEMYDVDEDDADAIYDAIQDAHIKIAFDDGDE